MKLFRGAGEASLVGNSDEVLEVTQLHRLNYLAKR